MDDSSLDSEKWYPQFRARQLTVGSNESYELVYGTSTTTGALYVMLPKNDDRAAI